MILHFECSSIAAKSWSALTDKYKSVWKCQDCLKASAKLVKISRKHSSSTEELENIAKQRKMGPNETLSADMLSEILDKKLKPLHEKFDALEKTFFPHITGQLKTHDIKITHLNKQVSELQQYTRKNAVIVNGIPKIQRNEDPVALILTFASKVGFELSKRDIDATHRLPTKKHELKKCPPLIVKFVSRVLKTDFIVHCRKLKPKADIMGGSVESNIFINEHLTKETSLLLQDAKKQLKDLKHRVTTRDCSVMAISEDSGKKIKITSHERLQELVQELQMGAIHTQKSPKSTSTNMET